MKLATVISVLRLVFILLASLGCSGCFTLGYLAQAGAGQVDLIRRGVPIATVVNDRSQPRQTRFLLHQVRRIKEWGQTRGLKPTQNYKRYSDLQRSAAVWVVQGCAPLSFDVRRWEFPIVGTVPYLGFFNEAEAHRYAAELKREERLDVWVRGAAAYSTLGWFNDPVLSTMLGEGPDAVGELADTILHESVHATVYVPGQSSFGESLASYVAEGLTPEWLAERFGADSAPVKAYAQSQERGARAVKELQETWTTLDALYRSKVDDATKLAQKERIFAALQQRLGARRPLNNAAIAGYRTYSSGKEGFDRLKAACGTWEKFLDAVKTLRPRDFNAPQQENFEPVLDSLARKQCPRLEPRASSLAPQ